MFMKPLKAEQSWTTYILSTLLENWSTSRASGAAPLPALIELAHRLDISSILAVALGSVFDLAEACLGRPLSVQHCCSDDLRPGEWALIHMLNDTLRDEDATALGAGSREIFDALLAAATSARRLLAPQEHELDRLWNTTHAARLCH
ncbi:MAG TPA: hypothetical protein VFG41_02930 [Sphingomicrobium sp.]|jgi:hypothetical protein|nr:hypothetical protein [Sphingomicrobium sp.]